MSQTAVGAGDREGLGPEPGTFCTMCLHGISVNQICHSCKSCLHICLSLGLRCPERRKRLGDPSKGLYNKFQVIRTDGQSAVDKKHERCQYFILDFNHDPFALPAIKAYAEACRGEYPLLAEDLMRIHEEESQEAQPDPAP